MQKFVKAKLGDMLTAPFEDSKTQEETIQMIKDAISTPETEFPVSKAVGCTDAVVKAVILAVRNDETRRINRVASRAAECSTPED